MAEDWRDGLPEPDEDGVVREPQRPAPGFGGTAEVDRVARLLIEAWEAAEGPVNASYVATFADMGRAVLDDEQNLRALLTQYVTDLRLYAARQPREDHADKMMRLVIAGWLERLLTGDLQQCPDKACSAVAPEGCRYPGWRMCVHAPERPRG